MAEVQKKRRVIVHRTGPVRRSKRGGWTAEEDDILRAAVAEYKGKNWKSIALKLNGRTNVQCLHRWQKVLNPNLMKGFWTQEEDALLKEKVAEHGAENWSMIAQYLNGRIGKQCRERWYNHLDPTIRKEPWTEEEIAQLVKIQGQLGNKWAEISKRIPGRPSNQCKNIFNSIQAKKRKRQKTENKAKRKDPRKRQKIHHARSKSDSAILRMTGAPDFFLTYQMSSLGLMGGNSSQTQHQQAPPQQRTPFQPIPQPLIVSPQFGGMTQQFPPPQIQNVPQPQFQSLQPMQQSSMDREVSSMLNDCFNNTGENDPNLMNITVNNPDTYETFQPQTQQIIQQPDVPTIQIDSDQTMTDVSMPNIDGFFVQDDQPELDKLISSPTKVRNARHHSRSTSFDVSYLQNHRFQPF